MKADLVMTAHVQGSESGAGNGPTTTMPRNTLPGPKFPEAFVATDWGKEALAGASSRRRASVTRKVLAM